ncbi:MAG: site-2 protease family protein [Victivallales bacterium]|nr:site-2 protease family protein [Victivallales bacterium]
MLFVQKLFTDPSAYFIWVVMVAFSVSCHEASHALTALWQGDDTAAANGYLTLNPFKQMGPWSLFALLFLGIAWGAVPVDPSKLKKKYSHALVAFAGPFMNFLLFIACAVGVSVVFIQSNGYIMENRVFQLFFTGGVLNIVLLIFNLIPVPPLDGWTIFTFIFPGIHNVNQEVRNGVLMGLFILVFFTFDKFFMIGTYCVVFALKLIVPLIS